jgi:protocatechuate 3,4-dioxygenase beta subunit
MNRTHPFLLASAVAVLLGLSPNAGAQEIKCSGTVTDAAGHLLAGATVEYWCYDGYPPLLANELELKTKTTTGSNGAFAIHVSRMAGILLAQKPGLAPAWQQLNQPMGSDSDMEEHLALTPPAALAGVVVDQAGQPVANAEVSVADASCEMPAEEEMQMANLLFGKPAHDCFTTRADAAGHFRIENFPTNAAAALAVQAPGKALRQSEMNLFGPASRPWRGGQEDIKLVVESAGSIEGKILVEGSNQAPPVARLTLRRQGSGLVSAREPVTSGADGAFRLGDVPAGTYRIKATFGTNPVPEWVAEAVPVAVESGQPTRGVEMTAMRGGLLEVAVLGENDGKSLAGVRVSTFMQNVPYTATSDSNGIALLWLPPGNYQVTALREYMTEFQTSASVETGQTNRVEIKIATPQKITGVVHQPDGHPAAGLPVRMVPGLASVKTDAEGKFEMKWNPRQFGQNNTTICLLVRDVEHNLAVAQDVDEDTRSLDLKLAPGLTLAGRVECEGKPVPNVAANLIFRSDRSGASLGNLSRSTNKPGRFEIPALPPGRQYGLNVSAPGYGRKSVNDVNASEKVGRMEVDPIELKLANLKIAGQVRDEDDKTVAGANVHLTGEDQPASSMTTDNKGRFQFQVCEGQVHLSAFPAQGGRGAQTSAEAGDTNVVLQFGQNNLNALAPGLVGPGINSHKLKGTVADDDGKPVAGAQVAVFPSFGQQHWAKTASNGAFSLTWSLQPWQIQQGGALLVVRDPDLNLGATKKLDEDTTNLNVKLKPALTLTGVVKNADDSPLAGAQLSVQLKAGNSYESLNQKIVASDAQGRYQIKGLPPDTSYLVVASAKGHGQSQQPVQSDPATNGAELMPFVLNLANRVVAGQVLNDDDKPVSGVNVSVSGLDQPTGNMTTDSKGRFHFQVCEGMVRLNANAQEGFAQASAEAGDTNVVLLLSRGGMSVGATQHKLTGTVTDADDKPVAGAQVAVLGGLVIRGVPWKKTETNGAFNLRWSLQPFQMQQGGASLLVARDPARGLAASEEVTQETTNLDLKLKPALTLTGLVNNEDGSPVANAQVNVEIKTGRMYLQFGQYNEPIASTDARGRYQIKDLPPDRAYFLVVSAKGHGQTREGVQADSATNRVEVSPVVLMLANRFLGGLVLDEKNKPVSGANVSLSGRGQPTSHMTTDSKGRFSFQVCEGTVNLFANSPMGGGFAQTAAEAGDTNIVLILGVQPAMQRVIRTGDTRVTRNVTPLVSLKGSPLPDLASVNLDAAHSSQAVLLCLFDAGQRPSRQAMRQLNEQAAALREQGVTVLGVQAVVTGGEILNEWKSESPVSFPLGRVTEKTELTKWMLDVPSLPWLILTDAQHRVVAEGFALDELDAEIKKLAK